MVRRRNWHSSFGRCQRLLAVLLPFLWLSPASATIYIPPGGGSGGVSGTCPTFATTSTLNGGVTSVTKTASYAIVATDCGTKLIYNSASPGTFTLPTVATGFTLPSVQNTGTGLLTIVAPTGVTINGVGPTTGGVVLSQWQTASVTTDGTNYFADIGTSGPLRPFTGTAGNWIGSSTLTSQTLTATAAYSSTVTYFCPFTFDRPMTLEGVGVQITTAQAAGDSMYVGLYAESAGRPAGSVLWQGSYAGTGTTFQTFSGFTPTATISVGTGRYWFAFQFGVTASPVVRLREVVYPGLLNQIDDASGANLVTTLSLTALTVSATTAGTMPPNPSGFADLITASYGCPMIAVQYASIP